MPANNHSGYTSRELVGFARERAALERETERALRQAEREGKRWAS